MITGTLLRSGGVRCYTGQETRPFARAVNRAFVRRKPNGQPDDLTLDA
jgi:hypothetical protein